MLVGRVGQRCPRCPWAFWKVGIDWTLSPPFVYRPDWNSLFLSLCLSWTSLGSSGEVDYQRRVELPWVQVEVESVVLALHSDWCGFGKEHLGC